MKALLLDPASHQVTEVDVPVTGEAHFLGIYAKIGATYVDYILVQLGPREEFHFVVTDIEALDRGQPRFVVKGYSADLAGKALVFARSGEMREDFADVTVSPAEIEPDLLWLTTSRPPKGAMTIEDLKRRFGRPRA